MAEVMELLLVQRKTTIRSLLRSGAVFPINGRIRDQLLNETLFPSLHYARAMLAAWRTDYNIARPHSRLGWQIPVEFARTFAAQRGLTLRNPQRPAPAPVAQPAQIDKTHIRGLAEAG